MRFTQRTHTAVAALLLASAASAPTVAGTSCEELSGRWMNENGSVLEIDSVTSEGRLQGRYHSSTGVDGRVFDLQGWVNRQDEGVAAIAWTVRWTGYASITSWTGSCDVVDQSPRIKTLWHLVRPDQEFDWERIIANGSTFRPEPAAP